MQEIQGKKLHEQIALCVIENGATLYESGKADLIKNKMPFPQQMRLLDEIFKVNEVNYSFEDLKKK